MRATFTISFPIPSHLTPAQIKEGIDEIALRLQDQFGKGPLPGSVTLGANHVELGDVDAFHRKFGVPMSPQPAFLDQAAQDYRHGFLQEELNEFQEAYLERDLEK